MVAYLSFCTTWRAACSTWTILLVSFYAHLSSLADLYRFSPREGFSPPPGAPGPNFVGGNKSINAGSVAKYVLDQAGLAESKARARREHPARGSRCLLRALGGVRSSLSLMLRSMANGESEPLLEASAADALPPSPPQPWMVLLAPFATSDTSWSRPWS